MKCAVTDVLYCILIIVCSVLQYPTANHILISYCTHIVVEAIILAATAFYRDTCCPTPEEAFITEASLSTDLLTGIDAAGTGVATVGTAQLIMAVGWTVESLKWDKESQSRDFNA